MVPDGQPAVVPPPADPLNRIAGLPEAIRDELEAIRKRLETAPAPAPSAGT
jgi:hypothetical protein